MTRRLLIALVSALLLAANAAAADRVTVNFNPDWRFIKDDPAGAQARGFDDSQWTIVSTPHTYNDVDTFDNWSTPGHRGEQIQWSGRTWYRKTFTAPAAWRGRKVFVELEAARQVAEGYLNGQRLGVSKTGFTPFGFDLTPSLLFGATNVLAVMVDNRFMKDPLDPATVAELATLNGSGGAAPPPTSQANPNLTQVQGEINKTIPERLEDLQADQIPWNNPHWHPAHGGLYRNVRLYVTDPLHISLPLYSFLQTAGPYAYATDITPASARVTIEVPVQNERASSEQVELRTSLVDADGRTVLTLTQTKTVAAGASAAFTVSGAVSNPRLWEPDYPHVYTVVNTLRAQAFRDVVIYFRNNPSVVVWEGGNQKVTREHAQELRKIMDTYDPHGGRAYAHRRADAITAEFMDVGVGTEGGREIASLPVFEGEYDREESPRRVWDKASPPNFGYPEAKEMTYQLTPEEYALNQVDQYVKKLGAPQHAGGANWIFSDSTSGGRVPAEVARAGGEVDGVRLPKEAYFVVSTMFRPDPQVHIVGHWSYPANTKNDVFVASNTDDDELFVNR